MYENVQFEIAIFIHFKTAIDTLQHALNYNQEDDNYFSR